MGLEIDWEDARRFVCGRLGRKYPGLNRDVVEDLAQEALVKLLRILRQEEVRNLDALLTLLADSVAADHFRKQEVRKRVLQPLTDVVADTARAEDILANEEDLLQRQQFVVLQFFKLHAPGCVEIARHRFKQVPLNTIAELIRSTYEATRARWSRCMRKVRDASDRLPGLFLLDGLSG